VRAAPGIVRAEGHDDCWTEEAKRWADVGGEEERHERLGGEVGAEVIAGVEDAY
jgi:hypothetical protein